MWWLCVRFPSLTLDSLGLRELAEPAIVTEQQKVIQANQAAAHHGIKSGQSIATALSLYPDIQALQRQPERELQLLEQTAVWAYRFSPAVSIDSELNSIHLELHGSLRLFKGFNRLFGALRGHKLVCGGACFSFRLACNGTGHHITKTNSTIYP